MAYPGERWLQDPDAEFKSESRNIAKALHDGKISAEQAEAALEVARNCQYLAKAMNKR